MKLFNVKYSTKLERLLDDYLESISPASDPLKPSIVIVQTEGVAKWMQLNIAKKNSVSANVDYLSPREYINYVSNNVLNMKKEFDPYSQKVLRWSIFDIQKNSSDDLARTWTLSCKIADIFDQYFMYRPELIEAWNSNKLLFAGTQYEKMELWQMELWGELKQKHQGIKDEVQKYKNILQEVNKTDANLIKQELGAVHLFAINSIPPQQLRFFDLLSEKTEVNLYVLSPSDQYWADIVSNKEKAKIILNGAESNVISLMDVGNELLASMGRVGRDFLCALMEHDANIISLDDDNQEFSDLNSMSALQILQLDIKNLDKKTFTPAYKNIRDSIDIVNCYSEFRELQVLYDKLLQSFESDSSLRTSDIIVTVPDIDKYAPVIDAVFMNSKIPYSIADRTLIKEMHETGLFVELLKVALSRFELSRVFGLLNDEVIKIKFGISEQDIHIIKEWFLHSGYRWGVDDNFKGIELGYNIKENTWTDLKNNLLLGYAMNFDNFKSFNGIFPNPNVSEGQASSTLTSLINFVDALAEITKLKHCTQTPKEWFTVLSKIVDEFFPDNDSRVDTVTIRSSLDKLVTQTEQAGFNSNIDINTVLRYLEDAYAFETTSRLFLNGKVLFCSMVPMRSIPCKVLALLGMNDDDYPRRVSNLQFDLLKAKPKPLDRSVRDNDRYLFLEAILSARTKLYISYVGKNINDAKKQEPSQLVNELLDYMEARFGVKKETLVQEYPLHSFSSKYITEDSELVTYSSDPIMNLNTEENLVEADFAIPFEKLEKEIVVTPQQFAQFFKDPIKQFLIKKAKIKPYQKEDSLIDEEPLSEDSPINKGLYKYKILELLLSKKSKPYKLRQYLRSASLLRYGVSGKADLLEIYKIKRAMSGLIRKIAKGRTPRSKKIELSYKVKDVTFVIKGELENIYDDIMILYKPGKTKTKDTFYNYILHLMHNQKTYVIDVEDKLTYSTIKDADKILTKLAEYYVKGNCEPILYSPDEHSEYSKYLELKYNFLSSGTKYNKEYLKVQQELWSFLNYEELSDK